MLWYLVNINLININLHECWRQLVKHNENVKLYWENKI